ncbi:hypothetical protein COX93_00030 [Candidatus Nomurabacteria bacterium CG_4_10_14_0_2_um_filter_30_12]|uniref:Uncharacterized protein n=1 Tax=Candidatus Nomurabacteria bacterium CG_4_10_14_0_2_um_filter_30_12 TaxID=1974727 RepID=A0A2J0MGR5_9BACT|nr:MAG: hypothetical protein COX93_00030 [Candidatus Nomurabacteria bacterium CG_4_10_14_0_2_um_filter_30_12]
MTQTNSSQKASPFVEISNEKPDLRKKEPPLLSVQVTNPVTYLKSWWKKVMGNEGVDFHFKIKPLTAIAMTIIIATIGFGVGKISFTPQKPFIKYVPTVITAPTPTPNPWRETAFSGTLRFSSTENRFYLLTTSSEAVNLDVLESVDFKKFIGRRIFATGKYNSDTRTLIVSDAADLELLPKQVEVVPVSIPAIPTATPMTQPVEEKVLPTPEIDSNSAI